MTSRLRRVTVLLSALVVLSGGSAVLAVPASAHARFERSDPAEGALLTQLPAAVVMSYSEEIAPQFVDTAVVPPGGDPVITESTADGLDVTLDLAGSTGLADAGEVVGAWQVVARVVSTDGHPVEHTVSFELDPAEVAAARPAAGANGAAPPVPSTTAPASDAPAEEPTAVTGDPVALVTDGLPSWALGAGAVLLALAAGAALVVQLRRRPPEA